MSLDETVVEGTLLPDGTLELDEKPTLAPGRVTVVLRQKSAAPAMEGDWFQHLQRIRAEREAAGYPFMNEREVTEHIDWLREGDSIDDLLHELDQQPEKSDQP